MISRFVLFFVALFAVVSPDSLLAQEYVRNGTFDTLYAFDWQASGNAWDPGNKSFPVATLQPNPCFGLVPDSSGFSLSQSITVPPGVHMVASVDVAVQVTANWSSSPSVSLTSTAASVFAQSSFSPQREDATRRIRLERRLITPASGTLVLSLSFLGIGAASSGHPAFYVDNVSLKTCVGATVHPRASALQLGSWTDLFVYTGTPGPIQLYLSPARQNPALPISGWSGQWELSVPTMIHAFSFGISSPGYVVFSFLVPNAPEVRGVPIYWQSLHAETTQVPPLLHLGTPNAWAFF